MTGTAIGARQIRDMRGREHRIFRRKVISPGQCCRSVAMAQSAIAADAGVQYRDRGQRRGGVVARSGGMTGGAGLAARIRHVADG